MEKDYTKIPVTLNVTLNDAVILAQLAAKLPIEQGLPLFEYLKQVLEPIITELQKQEQNENKVEDDQNTDPA
ncbi:hypothetical protein EKK58_07525 [Candidatus Dependentiae bacterium]|nr:MAG: hypothetical protein EKK58_07525 [Candidatus Dependentiae bacterium]